jgi:hypothetical protein
VLGTDACDGEKISVSVVVVVVVIVIVVIFVVVVSLCGMPDWDCEGI